MTRALVLGRRRPGREIGEAVEETRSLLEAAGWKVDSRLVTKKKALRKHAKRAVKDGQDVVVAVGGDGAVFQIVNALAESSTALGIVPKGTGNLLAGNLEIPTDTKKAVQILVEGEPRLIDLGRVTLDDGATRDFAVACGIGFDARVMDATEPEQKRTWGKLAYVANAVRESRRIRDVRHEIMIDGKPAKASAAQVFVANFGRIGSFVQPRRRVIPDDGRFDVFVVKATGPIEGLIAGWQALRQRHLGESDDGRVLRARATEVSVRSTPRQLVEADGSVIGRTPISVTIRPRALKVIAPSRG